MSKSLIGRQQGSVRDPSPLEPLALNLLLSSWDSEYPDMPIRRGTGLVLKQKKNEIRPQSLCMLPSGKFNAYLASAATVQESNTAD